MRVAVEADRGPIGELWWLDGLLPQREHTQTGAHLPLCPLSCNASAPLTATSLPTLHWWGGVPCWFAARHAALHKLAEDKCSVRVPSAPLDCLSQGVLISRIPPPRLIGSQPDPPGVRSQTAPFFPDSGGSVKIMGFSTEFVCLGVVALLPPCGSQGLP